MDIFTALDLSGSGLSVQRTRMNIASSNLANAQTTRTENGGPYRRMDPIVSTVAFDNELSGQLGIGEDAVAGAEVSDIVEDQSRGRRVYSPGHPDADGEGFVLFPNVNPVFEMVNLMSASRGFEANATAMEMTKTMAQRALDLLR